MIYTLHESHDDMARIVMEQGKLGATIGTSFNDRQEALDFAYAWGYKIIMIWDYIGGDDLPSLIETIEL